MSRVDQALRLWEAAREQTPGSDQPAASVRNTLGDYAQETAAPPQAPDVAAAERPVPAHTIEPPAAVPTRKLRPVQRQKTVRDPDVTARLVTGGLGAAPLEQYRRLAAALLETQSEGGPTTVMLTSAVPNEGKTLTTVNLALTLSESYDRRVLIVDADLRWPSVHHVLGVSNARGLSEALEDGNTELPTVAVSERLSVLTAGKPGPTPLAGLSSPRMTSLLADCARCFDWVLIDSPPVGLLSDAQLLARLAGAVILVIGAGDAPAAAIARAVADIGEECIVGTVLNRVDAKHTLDGYYEDYYSARTSTNDSHD
jgi:capsular exopolysaccharide synthesis family protein